MGLTFQLNIMIFSRLPGRAVTSCKTYEIYHVKDFFDLNLVKSVQKLMLAVCSPKSHHGVHYI